MSSETAEPEIEHAAPGEPVLIVRGSSSRIYHRPDGSGLPACPVRRGLEYREVEHRVLAGHYRPCRGCWGDR